ncbi:putative acetyltransferase involved in intracellular survival [Anaerohalosphaera lusitana]|uniref:Putative acetyltransferase involved in intracellular survival n=1 Tax=Anaerohalosphaera lusitana TaxID=1936003 RepID=A0A1U9NII6_9BACT|nr:GNAT family N-acetyltransferase [Anaerohalosphaera lusitana]AQT67400.1 putative acetyltransferase involved in intracellular survival [Anaerohalosphaera lusitana]
MTDRPRTLILNEDRIDRDLDTAIRELLSRCFPHRKPLFSRSRILGDNTPAFTVVILAGTLPIAHLAAVDRTITAGGEPFRVAGIANVCVDSPFRKQGLAGRMLDTAMQHAMKLGFDFGMLFCQGHVVNTYLRNGWQDIPPAPITYIDHGTKKQIPPNRHRLYYPLNKTTFPPGPINLQTNRW